MKNKKRIIIIVSIFIVLISGGIYFISNYKNNKEIEEILPEEEISEEQLRQTIVSLYYVNKETRELMPEARLVDVKVLINDPYLKLINLLIEEPKNSNLKSAMPNGTTINKVELKGDILFVDFSKEFIENHEGGIENEKNTIYSIVNTMTELTEINGIKILWCLEVGLWIKEAYYIDNTPEKVKKFMFEINWITDNWFDLENIIKI